MELPTNVGKTPCEDEELITGTESPMVAKLLWAKSDFVMAFAGVLIVATAKPGVAFASNVKPLSKSGPALTVAIGVPIISCCNGALTRGVAIEATTGTAGINGIFLTGSEIQ